MKSISVQQAVQLLRYLEQLHQLEIYHLDIRPETVVLENDKLRFIDFSNSVIVELSDLILLDKPQPPENQEYQVSRCNQKYCHPNLQQKFLAMKGFTKKDMALWDETSVISTLKEKCPELEVNFNASSIEKIPPISEIIKLWDRAK